MNRFHLLPPLPLKPHYISRVHQLLLLAELLHNELVFLDVFKIGLADGNDVIEYLTLLGTVRLCVHCLNLLNNIAILVIFEVLVDDPAVYFVA